MFKFETSDILKFYYSKFQPSSQISNITCRKKPENKVIQKKKDASLYPPFFLANIS